LSTSDDRPPAILIRGGRVFDGETVAHRPLDVLLRDGRIAVVSVGLPAPPDTRVINAAGCTVLPGLIDCHVHLTHAHETLPDVHDAEDPHHRWRVSRDWAAATLRAGFTTVRDLGSGDGLNIALAEAVARQEVPGPEIIACGRRIGPFPTGTIHGWRSGINVGAQGPDAVRAAVREEARRGARVIKLYAHSRIDRAAEVPRHVFSPEEMAAGVAEAHALGRRTAAHVFLGPVAHDAVEAGIDTLEHGTFMTPETVARMAERGTILVPTTHSVDLLELAPERLHDGRTTLKPAEVARLLHFRDCIFENVRRAKIAGVRIAAGSDQLGTRFDPGGNGGELWSLTRAGLTPAEALRSATSIAADALGLGHRTGRLCSGFDADVVVVRGDPLADIRLLHGPTNIRAVVKRGRLVVCSQREM
jgi:imidazolonepropionase-like amidohydrolase